MVPAPCTVMNEQQLINHDDNDNNTKNSNNEKQQQQQLGKKKTSTIETTADLVAKASAEIEEMRSSTNSATNRQFHSFKFPPSCLALLKSIEGNHRCVDCGEQNPQWAACRYGALLCLQCSGQHRSYGVQISSVRSLTMDEWSVTEVISMLEGGNSQIINFFARHHLTVDQCNAQQNSNNNNTVNNTSINKENVIRMRYKTKAALFYRRQMELHVANVLAAGPYRGREKSRLLKKSASMD